MKSDDPSLLIMLLWTLLCSSTVGCETAPEFYSLVMLFVLLPLLSTVDWISEWRRTNEASLLIVLLWTCCSNSVGVTSRPSREKDTPSSLLIVLFRSLSSRWVLAGASESLAEKDASSLLIVLLWGVAFASTSAVPWLGSPTENDGSLVIVCVWSGTLSSRSVMGGISDTATLYGNSSLLTIFSSRDVISKCSDASTENASAF